ncbi:hypothetical protein LOZ55_004058 [Ophidiomyces ophidiicola]|nr:hypothetical protein LOZ55_004058 [Ophidiomyces ophidiicola]
MAHTRTIAEIKLSFLRDQVRLLSTPLEPSEEWRDYGPETEHDISDKTVEGVLQKFNVAFSQHTRSVFSTQAFHHVSQQIERLYLNAVDPDLGEEHIHEFVLVKGSDLTAPESIERLPTEWIGENVDASAIERYKQLRTELISLTTTRKQHQRRLAQYKQLRNLLEPFREPKTNIQQNLVTKDGQLAAELGRMRMLLAKVAGRINQIEPQDGIMNKEANTSVDMDAKLANILDMT